MKKSKIFMILPSSVGDKGAATAPPPGLAYLAAVAFEEGNSVQAHDLRVESKSLMIEKIKKFEPDYICISFMSFGYKKTYSLIKFIKSIFPNIAVVIGGAHISLFKSKALEESGADIGIYGEGEETFKELLSGKKMGGIKGLIWKNKNGKIVLNPPRDPILNLDNIPFPKYEIFNLSKYVDKKIPIVSSRGCPYGCIFCAIGPTMGKKWRPRSPENVVEEIKYWCKKGYSYFHFVDDNIAQDSERFEKICDLICQNGLKIKWDLRNGIRVNKINSRLLNKMKKAGCFFYVLSVESFDDDVLRIMGKGINRKMIDQAIKDAKKANIPFGITIIVGLPGDTFDKFMKNLKLVKHHNFDEVRFYNAIPYPKTGLDRLIRENGRYLKKPEFFLNDKTTFGNNPLYSYPGFSVKQKKKALKKAQKVVMEKLIKKEFGNFAGTIGYYLWSIEIIRKPLMYFGTHLWKIIRKARNK